jgi:3D (Asp-Asp-Asp) domain-containing protein
MKIESKSSISIVKIICVSLILLALSGAGVIAMTTQINTVKITLASGYELTVLTNKSTVAEILEENNIVIEVNERVTPSLEDKITGNKTITICDKSTQEIQVAKISENGVETTLEEILENYSPIIEKIVTEEVEIPFRTITKDVSSNSENTKNKVVRQGENGIKQVTYKIKYKNNEELERTVLSETVIKEPVDKIVQVQKNVTSRSSSTSRGSSSGTTLYKVTAYCACKKCCGKTNGITASGTKATAGRTIATDGKFAFGTKLSINGTTYVVEDRGGAIKGNKIDMYFDSHAEALAWGVKYLPVKVVE